MDSSILLFILWLGIGFWGWWMLYKKVGVNFTQRLVFILMFVFLVPLGIATLLAGLIVPKQKECVYCRMAIMDNATVCRHCGREQ